MRFMSDDDYDARMDAWEDNQRKARQGCRCFAPGEAPGTCPGQENCPMCQEEDEEEAAEQDAEEDAP